MRKFLACSVVALGVFALAACGGGGGGGSENAFCDEAEKHADTINNAFGADFDITDNKVLDQLVTSAKALASAAPKDIKTEVNALKDYAEDFANAVKAAGDGEEERQEAASDFQEDADDVSDEAEKVGNYAADKCDVEIFGGSTDDATDLSDDLSDLSDLSDVSDLSDLSDLSDPLDSLSDLLGSDFNTDCLDQFSDLDPEELSDLSDFGDIYESCFSGN